MGHQRTLEAVFGLLEPRILLAAQPVVTISDAAPFIGESGSFSVTVQNVDDSTSGGRVGFQPYVDLIIPKTGADGKVTSPQSLPLDGVTFQSASLFGATLDPVVVTFDATGKATHPFARDSSGNLRVVNASDYGKDSSNNNLVKPGDQLVVLDLPFGSLVPEQPKMTITVNFSLSDHADLGKPLPVFAQGGFAFGRDALDNPTADHPVLGVFQKATITPSLFTLSKSFSGVENETATGPNFPQSFNLSFNVATGQQVLNPVFKDTLPVGIEVIGTPTMSVPGAVDYNPTTRVVTFTPTGPLTGVAGVDVTGTIGFYVTTVLDPITGAKVTLGNELSGTLGWIPIDPRDHVLDPVTGLPKPILFTQDPPGPEVSFDAKSIATQKGVALHTDVGAPGVGPKDTLQYTINIQVSDYFEFQNLKVRDILSDGQTFVAGSAKLTVEEANVTTGPLVFSEDNISAVETAGVTTLDLNISGLLGGDGVLTGGLFPGLPNKGATTLQITYLTTIDTAFYNGTVVSQGDSVSNAVTVRGDIRDSSGNVTQVERSDDSGSSIGIATGNLRKEVYAINGTILSAPTGEVRVKTYDLVTYRLTYDLPQSILGKLEFTDFLPLPIFGISGLNVSTLDTTVSPDAPAVNQMKYGPLSAQFETITSGFAPILTADAASNSFTFSFNNINPSPTAVTTADFLFTVRVEDQPFGDGLKLTNQVTSQEFKHGNVPSVFSTAIKQIVITEPDLRITKGVIQTDNNLGSFTLPSQGPVDFTNPGSSGTRFTPSGDPNNAAINSNNLVGKPVNSNLNNIDGGDLVSFGIVVENKGSSAGGAFDVTIKDTIPIGFSVPTSLAALNLRVTDGNGNAIAFEGSASDLFTMNGIRLIDDNINNIGALKPYNSTNGKNIVVITYDLLSDNNVQPNQGMTNTAAVIKYAAREGGANYIAERGPLSDTATVTTAIPKVDKVATETSLAQTTKAAGNTSLFDLAIGETITYEITATLPEGNIKGFNIKDILGQSPQKLTYLPNSASVIWIGGPGGTGSNLFTDAAWTNPLTSSGVSVGTDGTINFGFGTDVYNRPDNLVTDADRVKVRLTAFVPNVAENVAGQKVTNTGIVEYKEASGTSKTVQDTEDAEIVEPIFDLKKDTTTSIVERGDQVIYTVTLKNAAVSSSVFSAPAFDVTIDDGLLPGKLTLVPGTAQIVSAGTTATASVSEVDVGGNMVVRITSAEIMPDKQIQFQYTAVVSASVEAGTNLVNTVTLKGDSHPMTPTPPDQRPYSLSATETVTVKSPTLSKTVAATSIDETGSSFHDASLVDLAIGEVVTYRITVTAPEAVTKNFKVVDTLPFALQGGFKVLDAKVEVGGIGSNLTIESGKPDITWTNTTATFDFGTVTANAADRPASENQIKLEVKARVEDVAGVIKDGVQAINEAKLTFGTSGQAVATATVDIVEPKLQIVKAVTSPNGFVKPGETVDYTVTVSHLSTSTAPAFDLKVEDLISDPYLALVAGSVSINRGSVVLGNGTGDTTLRVTADKLLRNEPLAAGDVWTISFKAKVLSTTPGGATITNAATSSFDSAPGPGGRPDGGNATASIPGSPSLEKTIISTSNPDTGSDKFDPTLPDLTIGEKLTYRLVLTLPQGPTQNVSITDLLPAGLTPLDARLVSIGTGLSTTAQSIGFSGQSITATFGNVTNSTGAPIGAEDRITIEVDARVKDLPGLVAGDKLTNAAQANFTINGRTGSFGATASAEVVEAKLAIDKQVAPTVVSLGETFTYSVVLSHQAASTAPAYTIMVQDLLADPNLQLQAGSVTSSAGTISTGNGAGDKTIKVNLARLMPGEVLSISFQAKAISMPLPDGVAINTATFNHLSTPESLPSGFIRSGLGSDSANIQIATPSPKGPEGSPLFAYDEVLRRVRYGSFELPIILAGTADPGSSVGLEIKDATGAPVSVVGITADVGGHWMAPPIFTSAAPNEDLDSRAALRSLAGRETAPVGETRLSQPLPAAWLPTTTSAPYTVVTSEAVPAFLKEVFRRNVDVTFNGVIDSEGAVTGDPRQSFLAEKSTSSTWSSKQTIASPGSLVWNSFARDFAVSRQMGR
ncbi:MAG: isopeptide-forming domain-containing fimbrial protein [bacterium]